MKMLIVVFIMALSAMSLSAHAENDTALNRALYAEINANKGSYRYTKTVIEEHPADVIVEGWFDGNNLRKIVATFPGEHGTGVEEYYLEDGKPVFVFTSYDTVDMWTGKVSAVVENRYYFKDGVMFKWLDHEKQPVDPDSAVFIEEATILNSDSSHFVSILGDVQQDDISDYESPEDVNEEFGQVKKVEDGAYPMLLVTMEFGKGGVEEEFNLNAEYVGVTEGELSKLVNGEYVRFHYTFEKQNNLRDILADGKSLLGDYAPDLDPLWKKITGILKGAGKETARDLPDQISVTDTIGEQITFDYFIDQEIVAANGKTVTVFYDMDETATIKLLELPKSYEETSIVSLAVAMNDSDFVPEGWEIEDRVIGDLNNDSLRDSVLQIIKNGSDEEDYNRSLIILLASSEGGYTKAVEAKKIIMCSICGGMLGDGPADIKIENGVLIISQMYGSREATDYLLRFRYEPSNGKFLLIGEDVTNFDRATGLSESTSTNTLTGKQLLTNKVINENTGKEITTERFSTVNRDRQYIEDIDYASY